MFGGTGFNGVPHADFLMVRSPRSSQLGVRFRRHSREDPETFNIGQTAHGTRPIGRRKQTVDLPGGREAQMRVHTYVHA